MGDMTLGPTGSTVSLRPEYDYSNTKVIGRGDVRGKGGSLFTFDQGNYRQMVIPESFVTSANRLLVNSWWESITNLEFREDSDISSFENVRIVNASEPYPRFIQPYFQQFYVGELVLETI